MTKKTLQLAHALLRDPATRRSYKIAFLVASLIYLLSPVDILSELITPADAASFGLCCCMTPLTLVDDLAVLYCFALAFNYACPPSVSNKHRARLMNDESLQIDIPDHYDYRHPYSVIALAVGVSLIPFVGLVVGWSEHALGFILGSVPGFSLVSFFHKLFGLLTILLFFAGYVVLIIMNFSAIRRISKLIRDSKALEDETNRVKEELEKQGITIRLDPVCYLDSGRRLGLAEARGIGPYYIGLDASHLDNQELLIVPISHEISHLISGDQFILYSLLATGTGRLRGLANVYGILLRPWRYFSELSADRLMLLACGDIETVAEYFAEFFPNPEGDTGSELLAKARQYPKQINLMEIFQSHPSPVRRLQQLNDWGATYADQTR